MSTSARSRSSPASAGSRSTSRTSAAWFSPTSASRSGGFDVLAALRRSGPPYALSPGALQALTLVTSATTTHRIDRLQSGGYVARSPSPDDGRGVVVELTAAGREKVDKALELLASSEASLLKTFPRREQASLVDHLRRLLQELER